MKLHLGCGTVYLSDYCNVDIIGDITTNNPIATKYNSTTVNNYFKYPWGTRESNVVVVDVIDDIRELKKFQDNTIEEILTVNTIDHMKPEDFTLALRNWKRVLKTGGNLIIDIDDRQKQAEILVRANTIEEINWGIRLLYCHHRNQYDTHYWGYTPLTLKDLLKKDGWEYVWEKDNYITHDMYPNFQICVKKK